MSPICSPALQRLTTAKTPSPHPNPSLTTGRPQRLRGFHSLTGSPSDLWPSSCLSLRWRSPRSIWWWQELSGRPVPPWRPRLRKGRQHHLHLPRRCCPLTRTCQVNVKQDEAQTVGSQRTLLSPVIENKQNQSLFHLFFQASHLKLATHVRHTWRGEPSKPDEMAPHFGSRCCQKYKYAS